MYNQSEGISHERQIYEMQETGDPVQSDCYPPDLGYNLLRLEQVQTFVSKDSAGLCICMYFSSFSAQVAMVKANRISLLL